MTTTEQPHLTEARVIGGVRRKKKAHRPIFQHRTPIQQIVLAAAATTTTKTASSKDHTSNKQKQPSGAAAAAVENAASDHLSPKSVVIDESHHRHGNETLAAAPSARTANLAAPLTATQHQLQLQEKAAEEKAVVDDVVRLPAYAWKLHKRLVDASRRRNWWLACFNTQIIVLTAAAIVAAVFYGRYFEGYPSLDNGLALALFGATVVLPPYVIFEVRRKDRLLKQDPNDTALQVAAELESEIFLFRTQAGDYKDDTNHQDESVLPDHDLEGGIDPNLVVKDCFKRKAQAFWEKAKLSNVELPKDFWKDDDEQVKEGADTVVVVYPVAQIQRDPLEELPCIDPSKSAADLEAPPDEKTRLLPNDNKTVPDSSDDDDDHYHGRSLLTLDEYVQLRLEKIVTDKSEHMRMCQFWQSSIQQTVAVITFAVSLTGLLSMQWIIPALMAVTAACASILEVGSFRRTIEADRKLVDGLEDLRRQWLEVDDAEAKGRDQANYKENSDQLVEQVEVAILADLATR